MTTIEWTDETLNVVVGCDKISPGCKNCYAETFAERFRGIKNHPYEQGFDLRLVPEKLNEPSTWKQPRMVFVNSMSDLFHEDIPDSFILDVFMSMARAPQHTYQVLTKRAERLAALTQVFPRELVHQSYLWLGVSVEDCKYGLPRIDHLRNVPAMVRFLSIEPLLEDLGKIDLTGIHWVIVGGESGRKARVSNAAEIRAVVEQCRSQKVPVFVKQLGAIAIDTDYSGLAPLRIKHSKGGDIAEFPQDLQVRQFPHVVRQ